MELVVSGALVEGPCLVDRESTSLPATAGESSSCVSGSHVGVEARGGIFARGRDSAAVVRTGRQTLFRMCVGSFESRKTHVVLPDMHTNSRA